MKTYPLLNSALRHGNVFTVWRYRSVLS